ncbi:MAG: hypothetical protein ACRC4W_06920 [Treponemataceae bacterium]
MKLFAFFCIFFTACTSLTSYEADENIFLDTVYAIDEKNRSVEIQAFFLPEDDIVQLVFWIDFQKIILNLSQANRNAFLQTLQPKEFFSESSSYADFFYGSLLMKKKVLQFELSALHDKGTQLNLFLQGEPLATLSFSKEQFISLCNLLQEEALQEYFSIASDDEYIEENEINVQSY